MLKEEAINVSGANGQEPALSLTPAGADKVRRLLEEKEIPDHGLRVFVSGGGCSGMQYGMAFEEAPQDGDLVVEQQGVKLIVDPVSVTYLEGASIDYIEDDLMGGGFKIDNPNAVASCGCGHSFRTGQSAAGAGAGGGSCGY